MDRITNKARAFVLGCLPSQGERGPSAVVRGTRKMHFTLEARGMARALQDGCLPRRMQIGASRGRIGGVQGEDGGLRRIASELQACRRTPMLRFGVVLCFLPSCFFFQRRKDRTAEGPPQKNGNAKTHVATSRHGSSRLGRVASLAGRTSVQAGANRWCAGRERCARPRRWRERRVANSDFPMVRAGARAADTTLARNPK